MKAVSPVPLEMKRALAVRAEQALLEQLPETKAIRKAAKHFDPSKTKRYALVALGAAALASLLGSIGHAGIYHAAVARELRKQLAPINERLCVLEAQNAELKHQNELLREDLAKK